jgi:dienelactone hydrolase
MIPGYAVTMGLFLISWFFPVGAWSGNNAPTGVFWAAAVAICLLLGAAALGTILPVFELPKPTGPYPIGTVTRHLVDNSREETQSERAGEPRELMIQIWYPAEWAGRGQPYRPRAETEFKKAHLALVKTHAAAGTPVATAQPRYPVIIFTPSWTGRRNQNTVQAEELASHGFVVVGIDHPYGSDLTVFPDGRTVRTRLDDFLSWASDEALEQSVRIAEYQLRIRVADVRFVLDELQRLDQSDPEELLRGRLDTGRVGIFGHSFGGAVAAEACLRDARFKAGANFDGFFFGECLTHPIGKPFMVLGDDNPPPTPADLQASRGSAHREQRFVVQNWEGMCRALSGGCGYLAGIRGTSHMNFCDSPLYSPIRCLTHAGRIRPERAMKIINAYLLSFFEAYLNRQEGQEGTFLDVLSSEYPEVDMQRLSKAKP